MPEINSLIDKVKQEAARLTADVQEEDSAKIAPEAETQPQEGVEETTPEAAEKPESEETAEPKEGAEPQEGTEPKENPEGEDTTATIDLPEVVEDTLPDEAEMLAEALTDDGTTPATKVLPYHERYYLKYREGKRSTPLDLEGTKAFLQELGFDGGELRQARAGKDCAETFRNADKSKNNQMYCSYCGAEIAGVEFYRLRDGRMRCTTCSSTVLKTKAEVEELCQRVIANMDNFFGATIDVPVSIEVMDERKLKKKVGAPLGTKDSQSMLILGVAINKKKKYSIVLENGAPRISLIATFAHELTHIWQYTHWDDVKNFKKCPKSKRLLIYEGMAKWVEIQYLYLIGETGIAKREEYITRNREDEYGIGFRMYEDHYPLSREAMSCEDTPFTTDRYPFE